MKIQKKRLSLLLLSLFSGCGKGPKKTEGPTVGIDVARYQGAIDWDRGAAAGIDFVMVRGADGRAEEADTGAAPH